MTRGRALNVSLISNASRAILASCALALPISGALAQEAEGQERGVYVDQAPASTTEIRQIPDNTSKVYFPDAITPESVATARAEAAEQQQLERAAGEEAELTQVSTGDGARDVAQLSDGDSARALAQLSEAERQVLLEAVEGTDICDRTTNIPAIRDLCASRLETRSADFGRQVGNSAEDSLLGGGLDSERVATLEAAINRLAGVGADSNNFDNQVIASVALGSQTLTDAQATDAEGDPTEELSAETQALVAAIVQQLGGN